MNAVPYTAVRGNLAATMDRVCEDREAVIVTRHRRQAVVIISLEDYNVLEETAYLMRSPANARRFLASMRCLESGKGKVRKLKEV